MSRIDDEELLSEEELDKRMQRRERQEAVDFARANIGLEGFKPSEETEALARQFIDGEIDLAEFVRARENSDV